MAYIIQDSTLTGIADAIRAKRETTEKIKVSNMKAEIEAIEGDKSGAIIDRSITKYSNDNIKSIGNHAFYGCQALTSADFPSATDIEGYAFGNCCYLTSVDFPSATTIYRAAFQYCSSLTSVVFPNTTTIDDSAFQSCGALASVDFPSATTIDYSAFQSCGALASVDFPSATSIGGSAFQNCGALISVVFPSATRIGGYAFYECQALTSADFPSATDIGYNAFGNCASLINLILRGNTVCALSDNSALSGTKIESGTGHIYVPKSILDSYKTATNWSNYAAQFRALEDYTVDGTTTGELDTTKI